MAAIEFDVRVPLRTISVFDIRLRLLIGIVLVITCWLKGWKSNG
ncbi:hypothetical protein FHW66_002616 [Herbaspirillum sp. Sphag64]|nr:hypothetical protein [Herbaspirillum sp. Sphag64]